MIDKRKVLHEDGIYRKVPYQNLDFTGLTGPLVSSTSEADVAFGTQYFTLDVDGEHVKAGCVAQITSKADPDVWMWGLVMAKDTATSPARIKFAGLILSDTTLQNATDWEIQIMSGPLLGFSPDATIGISSDAIPIPTARQQISTNILAGRIVRRNMTLLFSDANNSENFFWLLVQSYNKETGAVTGSVIDFGGTGTPSAWVVSLVPGPPSGSFPLVETITRIAGSTEVHVPSPIGNLRVDPPAITLPAGIEEGDLIVIAYGGREEYNSAFTLSFPPGWIETTGCLVYKIADGSEASTTIQTSFSGANIILEANLVCEVFRPDKSAAVVVVDGDFNDYATPFSGVVGVTGLTSPLIVFGHGYGTSGPEVVFSTGEDGGASAFGSQGTVSLKYKIYNSSPVNNTITANAAASWLSGLYISMDGIPNEPGDTVVFEDDGSGNPKYPEGDGSAINLSENTTIVGLPKAIYAATITPTLLTGNISSVDTGTDIITWSSDLAAQGVVTGDTVIPAVGGTWPTGATTRGPLYIRMLSTTTFTLHRTLADALAGTSPINLTAAGSGTRTMHKLVHSNVGPNFGLSSVSPIGGSGTYETGIGFAVNFDPPLPDANRLIMLETRGLVSSNTPIAALSGVTNRPSSVTTSVAVFRSAADDLKVPSLDPAADTVPLTVGRALSRPGTWATQATTAFRVQLLVF